MDNSAVAARLHDGPLQDLTAARLQLEAMVATVQAHPDLTPAAKAALAPAMQSAMASVVQASTECRRLMEELDAEGP
jgi:signal transduction histidine kinase